MTFSVSTLCLASGAPLLFRIDSHLLRGLGAANQISSGRGRIAGKRLGGALRGAQVA